jgi:hypothetical protein
LSANDGTSNKDSFIENENLVADEEFDSSKLVV